MCLSVFQSNVSIYWDTKINSMIVIDLLKLLSWHKYTLYINIIFFLNWNFIHIRIFFSIFHSNNSIDLNANIISMILIEFLKPFQLAQMKRKQLYANSKDKSIPSQDYVG